MAISNIRNASRFKQTVLIIDDQPTVLDIHAAILKSLKLNLNIVTMTNPVKALEWMGKKQVDLIVTDFSMMHMDGMQFVQTINKANQVGPRPIIVITVLKDKKLHQQLVAAGAAVCLTKPANPEKLASMARFLLEESKQYYIQRQVATN
jgi:two-component system, chemotaxis family, chemotaxis protein CheY